MAANLPDDTTPSRSVTNQLQQLLLETEEFAAFLGELAALAAAAINGDVTCALTLRRDSEPYTVANADLRAAQLDEVQYSRGQGP